MKIIRILLFTVCFTMLTAWNALYADEAVYPDPQRYENDIQAFEHQDESEFPPEGAVLCVGSSSMRGWHSRIRRDLAPLTVIPRGFGGSNMNDVLFYADRLISAYSPRAVLLYEGDNDIAQGISPTVIADTYSRLLTAVREKNADVRFYVISIKPSPARRDMWPAMAEANSMLKDLCSRDLNAVFIDISRPMMNQDGSMRSDIYVSDSLHMNDGGYDIWKSVIRPVLLEEELFAESDGWNPMGDGALLKIIKSSNSMFPHPLREQGHYYDHVLYPADIHYSDSSVAVYVPAGFNPSQPFELVWYFHGWYNTIAESMEKFRLPQQIEGSGRNCILLFPEGPRNAPDSFGGRLEEECVFKKLCDEISAMLVEDGIIGDRQWTSMILAGHSGAYRVIGSILDRGGYADRVSGVILFDALYASEDIFAAWIRSGSGWFVNIVTPDGGTMDNSRSLDDVLKSEGLKVKTSEIKDIAGLTVSGTDRILTVYTGLGHSRVIDPFLEYLLKSY